MDLTSYVTEEAIKRMQGNNGIDPSQVLRTMMAQQTKIEELEQKYEVQLLDVPKDIMRAYKHMNPKMSEKDIQRHYTEAMKGKK